MELLFGGSSTPTGTSRFDGTSSAQNIAHQRLERRALGEAAAAATPAVAFSKIRLDDAKASTRAGFLRTLTEIIGPRPANDANGRLPWREEYEVLSVVWLEKERGRQGELRHFADKSHAELLAFLQSEDGGNYMQTNDIDMPAQLKAEQGAIDLLVSKGWHPEHAEAFQLLFPLRSALSADLDSSHSHGVRFPACNYAVAEALFHTASNRNASSGEQAPRRLYKHLTGPNSLTEADKAWGGLTVPDRTGFRGLTSAALCVATDDPRSFTAAGFRNATAEADGEVSYEVHAADVVCFESADNEEELMHTCVMIDEAHGALPANTLFRLKRVEDAGTWAVEGMVDKSADAPSPEGSKKKMTKPKTKRQSTAISPEEMRRQKAEAEKALVRGTVHPNCRLFVVSCTFKRPTEIVAEDTSNGKSTKMCGHVHTLMYASRETYVNGLDDILEDPPLTMEAEFLRPQPPITDFRGETFELSRLWSYVSGPAATAEMPTGLRDKTNDGFLPADFMRRANEHIAARREQIVEKAAGSASGFDPELLLLSPDDALLTLEETLAVRLYSGPAFQPINAFLREVGKLTGAFRTKMARHPELTFAATTRHLCRAIRKLADVTRYDEGTVLYRGVRGELPPAFWDRDLQGMISAVDNGFTSTSKNRHTPVHYMVGEFNVLWELAASSPSDDAYHCGADISMLSQYEHEDEVLFPPNTMLVVVPAPLAPGKERPKFAVGTKVHVKRSSGEETLGHIVEYHARGERYAVALPLGAVKFADESMLRVAEGQPPLAMDGPPRPPGGPSPPKRDSHTDGSDPNSSKDVQRARSVARNELSQDGIDAATGKRWKQIYVQPCFV